MEENEVVMENEEVREEEEDCTVNPVVVVALIGLLGAGAYHVGKKVAEVSYNVINRVKQKIVEKKHVSEQLVDAESKE